MALAPVRVKSRPINLHHPIAPPATKTTNFAVLHRFSTIASSLRDSTTTFDRAQAANGVIVRMTAAALQGAPVMTQDVDLLVRDTTLRVRDALRETE
jgi:hypothetical protein